MCLTGIFTDILRQFVHNVLGSTETGDGFEGWLCANLHF